MNQTLRSVLAGAALLPAAGVMAADDPGIQGALRENIQQSMKQFINANTLDGTFHYYDAVGGRLLKLTLDELHDGIVKKGGFYVSCADFRDQNGRKIDIDFMVRQSAGILKTTQAIVHAIDGKKRAYHLEEG